MPHYHKLGNIPHKRHTQFRKPDGGLYSEQLFSTEGFSNDYSLMYHVYPPTQIIKTEPQQIVAPTIAEEKMRSIAASKASTSSQKGFLQSLETGFGKQ
jgi:homogentisate 1,2-dioxygenase